MEEKKVIKVSLVTVVFIFIIILLILALFGMWYYYNKIQNNNIINPYENSDNNTVNTTVETSTKNQHNYAEINETNEKDNRKNIIMYGRTNIANFKPGIHSFVYEEKRYEDFYNTTYDIYQSGKNIGKTEGTIKEEYDAMHDVICYYIDYEKEERESINKRIYVSCNYDVVPRKYENVNEIPSIIKDEFYDSDSLKMQSIDLNGDDKKEYLVAYSRVNESLNEYIAGVYLYDSDYKKISMLATQNGYSEYLSDFDNITYMDIDNDSNMEIIINIPVASSYFRFGIYKYENNAVKGQIDTFGIGG